MWQLGKRLWKTLTKNQQRRAVLLTAAVILMALLEIVNVSAIAPFLALVSDPAMIEENSILTFLYEFFSFRNVNDFLIAVGIGVFSLMLLSNAWSALTTWAQLRLVWSWNDQLSVRLLERYLYRPYSYFLSRNTADLSKNLLSEVHQVTGQMIAPVILAIGRAVVALGIVVVLVVMSPGLALIVTVVVGGSYGTIYGFTRKRLNVIGRERVQANEQRFKVAGEALGGIKDVKVLNVERLFLERFTDASRRFSHHQATSAVIAALPRYAIEAVAFGTVILIIVYLIATESNFGTIVPMLGLYAFAGYRLMPALQQVFSGLTAVRFFGSALEAVLDDLGSDAEDDVGFVNRPSTNRGRNEGAQPAEVRQPMGLRHKLEVDNVSFTYPNSERPSIRSVSLTILANSAVGLVGTTGSGKTTLADIILGLLRPQSGRLLIDGVAITEENLSAWQTSIGYVPQHIFLTDASIAENIAFGVPIDRIDMDAVREAARIAHLDHFVSRELPLGYDTIVGERGIRLSGGQRQRIGIARALYKDPDVLVLDEATSALDNATEEKVMEAISNLLGKKTIIMIAHRLSTLKTCDSIFTFEEGSLVGVSTYDELIRGQSHLVQGLDSAHRDAELGRTI